MTTYIVAADTSTTPAAPPFPQPIINDVLTPDGTYDQTGVIVTADGSALTLQSLFIGSAIEVDLGFITSPTLAGSGNITGSNDTTKLLPAFVSAGGTTVDVNGTIAVAFTSNGQLTV
ncbi:MAG: hypothetical protein M3N26_03900, partial [Pseudomonadota bacterium]|nr:hypothetical protein [Pseudomonadota bacterium]